MLHKISLLLPLMAALTSPAVTRAQYQSFDECVVFEVLLVPDPSVPCCPEFPDDPTCKSLECLDENGVLTCECSVLLDLMIVMEKSPLDQAAGGDDEPLSAAAAVCCQEGTSIAEFQERRLLLLRLLLLPIRILQLPKFAQMRLRTFLIAMLQTRIHSHWTPRTVLFVHTPLR